MLHLSVLIWYNIILKRKQKNEKIPMNDKCVKFEMLKREEV